jgi:hypothetical protein
MPQRLIRDDMLDSERVLGVPVEARWLFVAVLLSADDVGLFEATAFKLARRADVRREHAEALLQQLADCDLVRLYEVDGKRYGFVPRFHQRLQIKRAKHPLPPVALLKDDDDALKKIKHLAVNPTVESSGPPLSTAGQPPEPEPEPEGKEIGPGSLRSPVPVAGAVAPSAVKVPKVKDDDKPWLQVAERCPHVKLVALYHELLPTLARVSVWDERRQAYSRARWREQAFQEQWPDETAGLRYFAKFFRYVSAKCPHLMGQSPPREGGAVFTADLEWLLRPTNFRKTVEGKYER